MLTVTKFQDAQIDLNQSESQVSDKENEANRIISNVSMTISHIVKSYDEVTNAAIDLLKSSTTYEQDLHEYEQHNVRQEVAS